MRSHDIEISEPAQPLASEQRQKAAAVTTTTTNKRAATRTKRELSDARLRGRKGIEKEHETVTTAIPGKEEGRMEEGEEEKIKNFNATTYSYF